jgi:polygalacturonase
VNPDSTTDVVIENCFISNGDDGVAIKSGLNEAGIKMGMPSSNITVRNITTHGRGGIAIGSESAFTPPTRSPINAAVRSKASLPYLWLRHISQRGFLPLVHPVSGGVKDVWIENVKLLGQRGVHMKTTRGRGGYIENITLVGVTAPAGIQVGRPFSISAIDPSLLSYIGSFLIVEKWLRC